MNKIQITKIKLGKEGKLSYNLHLEDAIAPLPVRELVRTP